MNNSFVVFMVVVTACLLTLGVMVLWHRRIQGAASDGYVRVGGGYSPVLTWAKRGLVMVGGRLRSLKESRETPVLLATVSSPSDLPSALPENPPAGETAAPLPPAASPAAAAADLSPSAPATPPASSSETESLKRQLEAIQTRAAALESELKQLRAPAFNLKEKWPLLVSLLLVLSLAVIPPLLVVQQRWFNDARLVDYFRARWWCKSSFLCQTAYPSYFIVIFVCFAALLVVMLWQKAALAAAWQTVQSGSGAPENALPVEDRQSRTGRNLLWAAAAGFVIVAAFNLAANSLPGWELLLVVALCLLGLWMREVPWARMADFWTRNYSFFLAATLVHVGLIAALASYFAAPQFFWACLILLALALANLWRYRQRLSPVYWLVSGALVLFSLNINGWWTSVVGDEFSFYTAAREIAERYDLIRLEDNLFNGLGVYGTHPYLSSYIQALFIKFLGHDGFGWRFSSVYLSALAVGLFFVFFKQFVSYRTAFLAATFLAASHYIMSFSKIGYNNLQALFAMGLALAAASWALRSRRYLAFAGLGVGLALCFYVYPVALYAVPLPLFLLLLYYPPTSRAALKHWGVMAWVAGMLLYPLFLQPAYWQAKIPGTVFYQPELVQSPGALINHFATNLLYAFFSFLYIPEEDHFVAASHVDPLTGTLVAIGLFYLLRQVRRRRFALFFIVGFIYLVVAVGTTHDRTFPSNTRMFMLLPWLALCAAFGLEWIFEHLKQLEVWRPASQRVALQVVMAGVVGLNVYQGYFLAYNRYAGSHQIEPLFVRLAETAHTLEPDEPKTYVFIVDKNWGIDGFTLFLDIYPLILSRARLAKIVVDGPTLPDTADQALLSDRNTLILIQPWLDKDWQAGLEAPLRALGKQPCIINTPDGQPRFTLYTVPELNKVCQ